MATLGSQGKVSWNREGQNTILHTWNDFQWGVSQVKGEWEEKCNTLFLSHLHPISQSQHEVDLNVICIVVKKKKSTLTFSPTIWRTGNSHSLTIAIHTCVISSHPKQLKTFFLPVWSGTTNLYHTIKLSLGGHFVKFVWKQKYIRHAFSVQVCTGVKMGGIPMAKYSFYG